MWDTLKPIRPHFQINEFKALLIFKSLQEAWYLNTHSHTDTHRKPMSMTFQRAGQCCASSPFQLLCVSTETDVSRGSRLSGDRRGPEHPSSASHRQTTRGGAVPRLHDLGQSHPEEGRRHHRPAWILTSSRSRSILLLLRLQLLRMQWIPPRLRREQIHEVLSSTLDDGSLLLYENLTASSISERLPPPLPPPPPPPLPASA